MGPERHCRERRGPSAGDGLGNRGATRARLPCMEREHGGTRAVSRRSGSPREARREGPTRAAVSSPGNVARGLQVLLPWQGLLAERKSVSGLLRSCLLRRLAGGGGRGPAARRRISQPIIPNKWRVNSPTGPAEPVSQEATGPVARSAADPSELLPKPMNRLRPFLQAAGTRIADPYGIPICVLRGRLRPFFVPGEYRKP